MKILVVDDEKQLANALVQILKANKYLAEAVYNGEDGLDYALSNSYDLIILDIMMPKLNGFEVLTRLRNKKIFTPILMLSAKSEVSDKVQGLNTGADDYLTKPFSTEELLARVGALTRRTGEIAIDCFEYCGLKLLKNSYELEFDSNRIKLSQKEYLIMERLISKKGNIMQKETLFEKIWGYESETEYNTIEVYMSFLRKKLAAIKSGVSIIACRGVGYSLEVNNA